MRAAIVPPVHLGASIITSDPKRSPASVRGGTAVLPNNHNWMASLTIASGEADRYSDHEPG